MAIISREQFLAQQEEQRSNAFNYNNASGPKVSYFKLSDDGDEAIVRFPYTSPEQYDIITVHERVNIGGKDRVINCLRDFRGPIDDCPLCKSGLRPQQRFFMKFDEYVRNEDGTISIVPRIWDRATEYAKVLDGFFSEYGNISDYIFKIKRAGKKGDKNTSYNIMPANVRIYNDETYPRDLSTFDTYNVLGSGVVLEKTYDELVELAKSNVPEEHPAEVRFSSPSSTVSPPINTTIPKRVTY